jgi:hypothetical protein
MKTKYKLRDLTENMPHINPSRPLCHRLVYRSQPPFKERNLRKEVIVSVLIKTEHFLHRVYAEFQTH